MRSRVLIAALILTSLALATVIFGPRVLGVLGALLLVLALPGYAAIVALFPRQDMPALLRLVLSVAVSMALTIVSGFVLHFGAIGLEPKAWAALLITVSVGCGAVAVWRAKPVERRGPAGPSLSVKDALWFGLALLLFCGAVVIARSGARSPSSPGFASLWLIPVPDREALATVGVGNHESHMQRYDLVLAVRDRPVREWNSIELAPGGHWETTVELPVGQRVVARLYRADDARAPYRQVWLVR